MEKQKKKVFRLSEKASEALRKLEVCEGKKIPIHIVIQAIIGGQHPHDLYRALVFNNDAFCKFFLRAAEQADKRCSRNRAHIGIYLFESDIEQIKVCRSVLFEMDFDREIKSRALTGSKVINRLLLLAADKPEEFKEFSKMLPKSSK